jgi:hypothetical protein
VSVIADAVAQQLSPVLREYFDLGLHTSWYHAGQVRARARAVFAYAGALTVCARAQLIFSEGQDADTLFVIISGRVRAFAQKNRFALAVASLRLPLARSRGLAQRLRRRQPRVWRLAHRVRPARVRLFGPVPRGV